jgi:23S rRNA (cytosine1962-C5)-methyltransferase
VRVTPDALRHVRAGHPWIFEDSITSVKPDGAPGDLAVVFDDRRRFAAIGLYDPASPIRIKVLHHGEPETIDAAWWQRRLAESVQRRAPLGGPVYPEPERATTAYRCVHGENDGLPGLVVDRYEATSVVKLYSAALVPHLDAIVDGFLAAQPDTTAFVLRASRAVAPQLPPELAGAVALRGSLPDRPVSFLERGLAFEADVVHGQKTGWFLDQRDNRTRVGTMADGARVLDVFCAGGGFGVHAAAGGARSLCSVDLSVQAVRTAEHSMWLNRDRPPVAACRHRGEVGDAFEVMTRLASRGERFDLVVVDPPSFAARQRNVPGALRAYRGLTALALDLLEPDGTLVQASCSSRVGADQFFAAVHEAADDRGWDLEELARTGQPLDHPVGFPQGAYLKCLFARALPRGRNRRRT